MKKYIFGILFFLPVISFASTYGSNIFTGGTATAISQLSGSYIPSYAFDGNTATFWSSDNASLPHWLKYDLGSSASSTPARFKIMVIGDGTCPSGGTVKGWDISVSNNDSNYYPLTTGTSTCANNGDRNFDTFDFTATTTKYRYFKLNISSNYRADNYTQVDEWEAYECLDCGGGGGSTSSVVSSGQFMSPELDQLIRYLLEAGVVALVAWFVIKLFR